MAGARDADATTMVGELMLRGASMTVAAITAITAITVAAALSPTPASAQESKSATFRGVEIKPPAGDYLVLKSVNVRARPETKSKRVGRLKRRQRVASPGRVRGPWIAVRVDGKDLGFVFAPTLLPVLEGALDDDLKGQLTPPPNSRKAPPCEYLIHFEGKSSAPGQLFEFADYDIHWTCSIGNSRARFHTPMYMSEGSYRGDSRALYQITIDIPELGGKAEDQFSTNMLFDRDAGVVRFDAVNIKELGVKPPEPEVAAATVAEALHRAVAMAHNVWTVKTWAELMGAVR